MEFGRDGGHADLVGHAGQGLDVADYLVDRRTVDRKILMHGPTPELRVMYLLQSFRSFRGSFNHNGRPSARSKLRIAYINFCSRDGQMLSTPEYTALAPLRKDASIWPSRSTRSGRRAATRRRHGGRKCTEIDLSRKHNSWYEVFELFRSPPIPVGGARALEPILEEQEFGNLPFGLDLVQPVAITFEPRRFGGRGTSGPGGKRSRPEMAPQRLEKIESAPGNGMGSEASDLQHLVRERVADGGRLGSCGKLQKKAPNALKSRDAELKSAPSSGASKGRQER